MGEIELLKLIQGAENSKVQFKVGLSKKSSEDIAAEIVAMSNHEGGHIIIGVHDKTGDIIGLTFEELEESNNFLFNWATNNVKPPVNLYTESVDVEGKKILVVEVPKEIDRPYCDNKMVYWIKSTANKRRVSPEELKRMFQAAGKVYAERAVLDRPVGDYIDSKTFKVFYESKYNEAVSDEGDEMLRLLENVELAKDGYFTVAGALLFGKNGQVLMPDFYITAIHFWEDAFVVDDYRSSENFYGNILELYNRSFDFIWSKLNRLQNEKGFNSLGVPEIPKIVFEEVLVNALIHRDYFINDSIKIYIFNNRIEIKSPGKLPNSLTEAQIKRGIRRTRNTILASFAFDVLPYRGIGSGVLRALQAYPKIDFKNDIEGEQFVVTIPRPEIKK